MANLTEGEFEQLMSMLVSMQSQITGLTTTVRALIESHPDREAVDRILKRQHLRLEAVLGASTTPDPAIATILSLLDDMRTIARRDPEGS